MTSNPTVIIILLLLLKNQKQMVPPLNTLQLESFLDSAQRFIETIDKISTLSSDAMTALPNMNNLLKLAGPILSSMNSDTTSNTVDNESKEI